MRDARDRHESLTDALAQLGPKIADAEARLLDLRKAAERREAATAANAEAAALEAAAEAVSYGISSTAFGDRANCKAP